MINKKYPRVGAEIFHTQLENGLHIYVDCRPEYQKSFAFFATKYGGMDMKFQLNGQWQDTPAGVAHFLEHKMFDTEDGNALQDLAQNGASPNAFTSSAITGYFFESTEEFEANLSILLSFVSVPYFTPESVDKEQGIIGQEIRMIEDDPDHQVFYALMECMYHHHPIRVSVAGTQESISHITADTLYDCHRAFYSPANMVLTVAGNVDPERVAAIAQKILSKEPCTNIDRDYGMAESSSVRQSEKTLYMEVSTPIFQLGLKADAPTSGEARLRQQLTGELAAEALLGTSSPLYTRLYQAGLITKNYGYGYENYPGCAFLAVGGESHDPQAVREAVLQEAGRIGVEGVDEALFQRLKKAAYGNRVRALNSFDTICIELAQGHFAAFEYLRFPDVFDQITRGDLENCIRTWGVAERAALAVVRPKETI